MLLDEFVNFKTGMIFPNGTSVDKVMDPWKVRAHTYAQSYVLDADAVDMAISVYLSKPSSIISALPLVRLPHKLTWIEFDNIDVRNAAQNMGSPNRQIVYEIKATILKSGMLIEEESEGVLKASYISKKRVFGMDGETVDLGMLQIYFDGKNCFDALERLRASKLDVSLGMLKDALGIKPNIAKDISGAFRKNFENVQNDPLESLANGLLKDSIALGLNPIYEAISKSAIELMGKEKFDAIAREQVPETLHLFQAIILPALILLNTRNAVDEVPVFHSPKHAKKRIQSGKLPLIAHKIVKMHLTASRREAIKSGNREDRAIRSHVVRGHFKNRNGKLFWWSPHVRSGFGFVSKTTVLTR